MEVCQDILDYDAPMRSEYQHGDRREIPRYSLAEVAHYIHVPLHDLKYWVYGRSYTRADGRLVTITPLITPPREDDTRLSFFNLVEAHILKSTTKLDEVPLTAVRLALDFVAKNDPVPHPLITAKFLTEGAALFQRVLTEAVEEQPAVQLVNATRHGQLAFAHLLEPYLERIDRDSNGAPFTLFPIIPNKPDSKAVSIRAGVSSGVPTIAGRGISIPILHGRHEAGDSISELSDDYNLDATQVREAIDYYEAA